MTCSLRVTRIFIEGKRQLLNTVKMDFLLCEDDKGHQGWWRKAQNLNLGGER